MQQHVTTDSDVAPFNGGPFSDALKAIRLTAIPYNWRAIAAALLVGWVPLVVLAAFEGNLVGPTPKEAILYDIAIFVRYVISLPLLLVAEPFCLPALAAIVRVFGESNLVRDPEDLKRYHALVETTPRLLKSRVVALAILALAYAQVYALRASLLPTFGDTWRTRIVGGSPVLTPAGWWLALVSLPIFLAAVYAWGWRLFLWARLLWHLGQMDLRLVVTHPDLVGGIGFVSRAARVLSLVAFAVACVPAGMVADLVLFDGRDIREFEIPVAVIVVVLVALIVGPQTFLYPAVRRARLRGVIEYGVLARSFGQRLHEKWIVENKAQADRSTLEVPDFSAGTDLYQVVERVQQMRWLPVTFKDIGRVAAATALPFVPVLLTQVPAKQVWETMVKLVL
jgi:hypothetical protein